MNILECFDVNLWMRNHLTENDHVNEIKNIDFIEKQMVFVK